MRGMSSTTMSHTPMRAAPALSASAERRSDEPREVIETAPHGPVGRSLYSRHPRVGNPRGDPAARVHDDQICRLAARARTDAVARRTRIRRVGGEPRARSRSCTAFRWIYLPVTLYRWLSADPGILLSPTRWFRPLRVDVLRDGLGLVYFHAGARLLRHRCWNDCCADDRALTRVHHVFVAR